MPRVQVKPLGELWKVMRRDEYLNLKDGGNIYDLIKAIDAQYGTKIWESSINTDTMDLQESATIFVNGYPVRGKLDSMLRDGDIVIIYPDVGCC